MKKNITACPTQSHSSSVTSPIIYAPQIPTSGIDRCNLCGLEILGHLIYTNPDCGHNYCFYCVQELAVSHRNLKFCYLKRCSKSLNITEINEFYQRCGNQEKSQSLTENITPKPQAPLDLYLGQKVNNTKSIENMQQNKLEKCDLCELEILGHLIYTNPDCRHNYCYYCAQELAVSHRNLKICYLKRCSKSLNIAEINEFRKRCDGQEKGQPSHNNNTQKRHTCSCCDEEVDQTNPIVFTNKKCGHSFCRNWEETNKPVFDGICFREKCTEKVNFEDFQKALKKATIHFFTVRCNKCSKMRDSRKIFVSSSCQHIFCESCTNSIESISCSVLNCPAQFDEEKLLLFKANNVMKEESKRLEKKTVTCLSCNQYTTLSLPRGSNIDYWKCANCLKISCLQHNGVMSKCLCLCPRCLGSLQGAQSPNAKKCNKCSISYCLNCEKENKINEFCPCLANKSKMKIESLQNLAQKCQSGLLNDILSTSHSYLEIISPSPNFFLIGFLLTQDILSQPVSDESSHLQQNIISSFKSLVSINQSYQTRLDKAKLQLEDLSQLINFLSQDGTFNVKDKLSVGNFIVESLQNDNDLKEVIGWLGRCTLVDYMVNQELDVKIPSMFKKLIDENSKPNDIDIEDVLSMFCDCFNYNIQLFYENGNKVNRKDFGQQNAVYSAQVLDLSQQGKSLAILYSK